MKAQATIEFMVGFLSIILCISLFSAVLITAKNQIIEKSHQVERTTQVEAAARATEANYYTKLTTSLDFLEDNVSSRPGPNNKLLVTYKEFYVSHGQVLYNNTVIQVSGIFEN